jgi:hypothetical protein
MGLPVPCALGNHVATPVGVADPAVVAKAGPLVEPAVAAAPVAGGIISVKKREAEASADTLFYEDTYKYPGYTYRAYTNISPIAVPTTYTVSDPIVKTVEKPVAAKTYAAPAPIASNVVSTSYVTAPVAAAAYVAPAPVVAAGCRNGQGSLVPCA